MNHKDYIQGKADENALRDEKSAAQKALDRAKELEAKRMAQGWSYVKSDSKTLRLEKR